MTAAQQLKLSKPDKAEGFDRRFESAAVAFLKAEGL